jgi:hypothetical protein
MSLGAWLRIAHYLPSLSNVVLARIQKSFYVGPLRSFSAALIPFQEGVRIFWL